MIDLEMMMVILMTNINDEEANTLENISKNINNTGNKVIREYKEINNNELEIIKEDLSNEYKDFITLLNTIKKLYDEISVALNNKRINDFIKISNEYYENLQKTYFFDNFGKELDKFLLSKNIFEYEYSLGVLNIEKNYFESELRNNPFKLASEIRMKLNDNIIYYISNIMDKAIKNTKQLDKYFKKYGGDTEELYKKIVPEVFNNLENSFSQTYTRTKEINDVLSLKELMITSISNSSKLAMNYQSAYDLLCYILRTTITNFENINEQIIEKNNEMKILDEKIKYLNRNIELLEEKQRTKQKEFEVLQQKIKNINIDIKNIGNKFEVKTDNIEKTLNRDNVISNNEDNKEEPIDEIEKALLKDDEDEEESILKEE